jgi:hypothetical protein
MHIELHLREANQRRGSRRVGYMFRKFGQFRCPPLRTQSKCRLVLYTPKQNREMSRARCDMWLHLGAFRVDVYCRIMRYP